LRACGGHRERHQTHSNYAHVYRPVTGMVRMELKGSFDAVQGEVEDVVVAQHARFRSLPVLTHNGARDKEWHALLTEPSINCH
jgi:hypothetical protein